MERTCVLPRLAYVLRLILLRIQEAVQPSMYTPNGAVQEFRYTTTLLSAFNGQNGGIASLQNLDNRGWVASASANVFVANHDTERGGNSLNYQAPSNEYTNAMIFSLAHPYGTPTILSSYQYSSYDAGAPNNSKDHLAWVVYIGTHSSTRCRDVLWERGREWMAVPASVDRHCRHGRLPEQRLWVDRKLDVTTVEPDRVRPRLLRLCHHQQRRLGVVVDVYHSALVWHVLRCDKRRHHFVDLMLW
jgi:hypothetical protein